MDGVEEKEGLGLADSPLPGQTLLDPPLEARRERGMDASKSENKTA